MNENNELNVLKDKIEHCIRLSLLKILWWCCNASNTSEAEKFNRSTFYWIKVLSLSFKIPIIHNFRDESGKIKHPVLFNSSRSILECVNENELEMFCVKSYTESDIWSKLQKLLKSFFVLAPVRRNIAELSAVFTQWNDEHYFKHQQTYFIITAILFANAN